jgi:hypothetical protein
MIITSKGTLTKDEFEYIDLLMKYDKLLKQFQFSNYVTIDLLDVCFELLDSVPKEKMDNIIHRIDTANEILNHGYEWAISGDVLH